LHIPGFPRLSEEVPFMPGEQTILAGVSGAGKSGIGWQIAINVARDFRDSGKLRSETGGIVGYSLEMTTAQLGYRALSAASGVPAHLIFKGQMTQHQFEAVGRAKEELKGLPIEIDEGGMLTPSTMEMRLIQAQRYFGGKIALVIIDHVNLISISEAKSNNPAFAYGQIADSIMYLAKKFNTHFLCLCQLNEKDFTRPGRQDKRPTRGDIRWSSNWVNNANNILFIHRPIMWEPKTEPVSDTIYDPPEEVEKKVKNWRTRQEEMAAIAELLVEKNRMGRAGLTMPLLFDANTTTFSQDPTNKR
jgi:replicative DNA helicase